MSEPTVSHNSVPLLRLVPVILGIVGLAAMIIVAAMAGRFLTWHYMLGLLSLISTGIGLVWIQDGKWQKILYTLAYSFFFTLCVALVYLISANRYVRFDITQNQVHTLNQQTKSFLAQLSTEESYNIKVFAPGGEHLQLQRFLNNYRREAPQVHYKLYDAERDYDIVIEEGGAIKNGDIIVTRIDEEGTIVRKEIGTLKASDDEREGKLTNLLISSQYLEQGVIYFTTSHGEKRFERSEISYSILSEILNNTSFPVKPIRLLQGPIPADTAALVIAGPTTDLFDQELEMLKDYLDEGGKLFLLFDPVFRNTDQYGNFDKLLSQMGVKAPNEMIVDPIAMNASKSTYTPLVQYNSKHPMATQAADLSPFMLNQSRPLMITDSENEKAIRQIVLQTHENIWTEPYNNLRSVRSPVPPENKEEIGVCYTAISIEFPTDGGRFGNTTRAVVIGDSDAFIDEHIEKNGGAAAFFINTLAWMRESRSFIYIPPRLLNSTPVMITSSQFYTLLAMFLLAGLTITLGGTAWTMLRRRSK
jgi:ABC transporter family protein